MFLQDYGLVLIYGDVYYGIKEYLENYNKN